MAGLMSMLGLSGLVGGGLGLSPGCYQALPGQLLNFTSTQWEPLIFSVTAPQTPPLLTEDHWVTDSRPMETFDEWVDRVIAWHHWEYS